MNGKMILLAILCINFVALMIGNACLSPDVNCSTGLTSSLEKSPFASFYNINSLQQPLSSVGGPDINTGFDGAISDLTKQEAGGEVQTSGGISLRSIVDGLKMIGAFITLLTPLPSMALLVSLSLPWWVVTLLSIVFIILYVVSIAEFIRGASF